MKVKLKDTHKRKYTGWTDDKLYHVIAYCYSGEKTEYIVANDALSVSHTGAEMFDIVYEADDTNYIQKNELYFGNEFHIDEKMLEIFDFNTTWHIMQWNFIWPKSKLYKYFRYYNYELTDEYVKTALNDDYKLALLAGFMEFANIYKNFKNDHHWQEFFWVQKVHKFQEQEDINNGAAKQNDSIHEFRVEDYEKEFKQFVSERLYDEEVSRENSDAITHKLFYLFDAMFIDEIEKVYHVKTFYVDSIVVKYKDNYYYMSNEWHS